MVEEAGHLSGTGEEGFGLKLCVTPVYHSLAEDFPRICVDGKDDKDLKSVVAFARRLAVIARGNVSG